MTRGGSGQTADRAVLGLACGGCDVAVLDTDAFILDVAAAADIRLWPIAVDGKYADIEAMEDGELDLAIFNGAVRNSENEHIAKLLPREEQAPRRVRGRAPISGGIPGLANLTTRDEILSTAYLENPSLEKGSKTLPLPESGVNGTTLTIPSFYKRVYKLDDIVPVDYYVPGCPPAFDQVQAVLQAGRDAAICRPSARWWGPPTGRCATTARACKSEKRIKQFHRPWQIMIDPDGLPAGAGASSAPARPRGPAAERAARPAASPAAAATDRSTTSSIRARSCSQRSSSVIDSTDPEEIDRIIDGLPDFTGFAYRFSLPSSLLQGACGMSGVPAARRSCTPEGSAS